MTDKDKIDNPLTEEDLNAAAYLCFMSAAWTDLSEISGPLSRRMHYERKWRFENALKLMEGGTISLLELGLGYKDCSFVIARSDKFKNKESVKSRFQMAEEILKGKAEAQFR